MGSTNTTQPLPDPSEFSGGMVIPCAVTTAALSSVFVALRFYTRAGILHVLGWEDWLVLIALVRESSLLRVGGLQLNGDRSLVLVQVLEWQLVSTRHSLACRYSTLTESRLELDVGLGQHWVYAQFYFRDYLKAGLFTSLTYSLSLTFTKLSILCLYVRILTYEYVRLVGKILLGIVIITHTWIVCDILTTCIPLDSFWDLSKKRVYCHDVAVFWSNAGLLIATDFLIFLFPLPVVWQLRLPWRQKLGLCLVFMLGFG
jgi:hypothetical protein